MHAAAVLDNRLYVIGGRTSEEECSSRVDRFDPTRNEWESVAPLAVERQRLAAVTAGERIYAIGGERLGDFVTDVEAYDAASSTWTSCKPMPTAPEGVAVGVLTVDKP